MMNKSIKDKLPLQSKKFLAYLIADIGWKLLMFYVVWEYKTKIDRYAFLILVSMIVTTGFIQIGYILGQAFIDRYVMIALAAIDQEDNAEDHKDKKKSDT
jgi:hypothetical protein